MPGRSMALASPTRLAPSSILEGSLSKSKSLERLPHDDVDSPRAVRTQDMVMLNVARAARPGDQGDAAGSLEGGSTLAREPIFQMNKEPISRQKRDVNGRQK